MNLLLLGPLLLSWASGTEVDCSCGYSVNATSDPSHAVFTEILETDFLNLRSIDRNACWQPQEYNVSVANSHGEYGKMATPQNVIANPLRPGSQTLGIYGGDAGLQLWVNSTIVDDKIPMAELVAAPNDIAYGSFRVDMKITSVPGTCSAFFWYHDNTEEIDMEFLSSQFNASSHPVFLVMQTPLSAQATIKKSGISTYAIIELPLAPEQGFHEYRFDWTPQRMSFYADGNWIQDMFYKYKDVAGHLTLNHWSNGNQEWSGGPPTSDAVTTISYVKAYFNSSDPTRQSMYHARCPNQGDEAKICQIPDLSWPVDNGKPFFFSSSMCERLPATPTTTNTRRASVSRERTPISTTLLVTATPTRTSWAASRSQLSAAASVLDVPSFMRGFTLGVPMGIFAIAGEYC